MRARSGDETLHLLITESTSECDSHSLLLLALLRSLLPFLGGRRLLSGVGFWKHFRVSGLGGPPFRLDGVLIPRLSWLVVEHILTR